MLILFHWLPHFVSMIEVKPFHWALFMLSNHTIASVVQSLYARLTLYESELQ